MIQEQQPPSVARMSWQEGYKGAFQNLPSLLLIPQGGFAVCLTHHPPVFASPDLP